MNPLWRSNLMGEPSFPFKIPGSATAVLWKDINCGNAHQMQQNWYCTVSVYSLISFSDTLIPKKWLIQGCFKRGVLFCLVSFFKRGIHAVLFLVFKMVSTIKIRYFYHILSRFSDEMRVSGGGDSTPSSLDPSMLIYFSKWIIHVYFFFFCCIYMNRLLTKGVCTMFRFQYLCIFFVIEENLPPNEMFPAVQLYHIYIPDIEWYVHGMHSDMLCKYTIVKIEFKEKGKNAARK